MFPLQPTSVISRTKQFVDISKWSMITSTGPDNPEGHLQLERDQRLITPTKQLLVSVHWPQCIIYTPMIGAFMIHYLIHHFTLPGICIPYYSRWCIFQVTTCSLRLALHGNLETKLDSQLVLWMRTKLCVCSSTIIWVVLILDHLTSGFRFVR